MDADEDIKAGRVKSFDTVEELIADLDRPFEGEGADEGDLDALNDALAEPGPRVPHEEMKRPI